MRTGLYIGDCWISVPICGILYSLFNFWPVLFCGSDKKLFCFVCSKLSLFLFVGSNLLWAKTKKLKNKSFTDSAIYYVGGQNNNKTEKWSVL